MSMSISGAGGMGAASAVSGASMRTPPHQKMTNLYQQIDTSGSGSISKAQFQQAFNTLNPPAAFKNAGFDKVYNQIDPSGKGSVSQTDFVNAMKGMMASLRAGG